MTFISFVAIIFIIVRKLIFGDPVSGWPSLVCIITFVGGIQLFCMGIMGQYLSKTYMEVKKRPHYIIQKSNDEETEKNKWVWTWINVYQNKRKKNRKSAAALNFSKLQHFFLFFWQLYHNNVMNYCNTVFWWIGIKLLVLFGLFDGSNLFTAGLVKLNTNCLLYTSPSPRD